MSLFADGSLSGNASLLSGTRAVTGKWHISKNSLFCYQVSVGSSGNQACEEWYRLGADYYSALGPQLALKREVSRP